MSVTDEHLTKIRAELNTAIKGHSPASDSFFHNGGTLLALAATTTATLLPASQLFWARIASGVATFVIALSRALDFGGRWRWHIEMRNGYRSMLDRVNLVEILPDDERLAEMKRIYHDLAALRLRENTIPGSGTAATTS